MFGLEEKILKPGDVSIDELLLMTQNGDIYDFVNFYIDLIIREDMWSPAMFGEISVTDANDMINTANIRGGEILNIKLRSKTLEDVPANVINKSFQIYAIENRILI